MTVENILIQLDDAAQGLYYMSESDYPFETFLYPKNSENPTEIQDVLSPQNLLDWLKKPIETLVEIVELDFFFRNMLKNEPKFIQLIETLTANLTDILVYKVGQIEIECYIIGKTQTGDFAGLKTIAIET